MRIQIGEDETPAEAPALSMPGLQRLQLAIRFARKGKDSRALETLIDMDEPDVRAALDVTIQIQQCLMAAGTNYQFAKLMQLQKDEIGVLSGPTPSSNDEHPDWNKAGVPAARTGEAASA